MQQWLQTQTLQDKNKPDPDERNGLYQLLFPCCQYLGFHSNSLIGSRWRSKPAPQRESFRTVSTRLTLLLCGSWKWGRRWAIIFWCLKCTTSLSSQSRWAWQKNLFYSFIKDHFKTFLMLVSKHWPQKSMLLIFFVSSNSVILNKFFFWKL